MVTDVIETIVKGSTTEFLNIPEKEFFSKYKTITNESAQKCTKDYFREKKLKIDLKVIDVKLEEDTHNVKITLDRISSK